MGGERVQLNEAISRRIQELLTEKEMTPYRLYKMSGVPKSTISSVLNCVNDSMQLRIIHELCQGLNIGLEEFFSSPLFDENNLEP